jgi:hypothetical protein
LETHHLLPVLLRCENPLPWGITEEDILSLPNSTAQAFLDALGCPAEDIFETLGEIFDVADVALQDLNMEVNVEIFRRWKSWPCRVTDVQRSS